MGRATDFNQCYIYHIKSKDGEVCYVGSTSNLNSRKSSHRYNCSHENNKFYHLDIYKYIRNNGGFSNFQIVPIRKLENVKNKNDLLIAEQAEMNKYSGLKNMRGSYQTEEERVKQNLQWRKENPEKIRQSYKKYYEANKEQIIEKTRIWMKEHPEKNSENHRQWLKEHPEKNSEYCKKYYESNKEKISQYKETNKDRIREQKRQWREKNKDKINEKRRQRYQEKKQLEASDQ